MTRKSYSTFHILMQKFASSRPGAWVSSRLLHHLDLFFLKVSNGRWMLTSLLTSLPVVILTTTGAKSGLPRTLPLLFIPDEQDSTAFSLIASNWGQTHYPAWYFNLKANSHATCSIDGHIGEYLAHEASGEEYERFWRYAVNMYAGYHFYKQRVGKRRIPIMVMKPL
jgi:deazaflavin-dependent oxidoreductase (nitroreductase family)